jgi:hypothetical protein
MTRKHCSGIISNALALLALLALAACGGGGTSPSASGGVIGGTGFKGPVSGATVTAYAVSGGSRGAQIGTTTTDPGGGFTLSIGSHTGPVMLQLSGGTYTDEATGSPMNMVSGDVMTAILPTVAANATMSGIQITPLTSMAQTLAQNQAGGMTDANIMSANAAIGSYFLVSDILRVSPMNPLVAGSGSTATTDTMNYGMSIAAMSEYARSLGMTTSSAMVTALMNDSSDGFMNGRMGQSPVMMGGMGMGTTMSPSAGTRDLAGAMSAFTASAQNRSGVTASMMQSLIARLGASSGQLVF